MRNAGPSVAARSCGLHAVARVALRAARSAAGALVLVLTVLEFPVAAGAEPVESFAPVFPVTPLDTPLVMTGKFGERRSRHFHAGLDLSVGGVVGAPVRAPMEGWIERVRTQGGGYGRSIYLHTADDRLVVLAHLDAFAEPLASFMAAAQESSGRYDQDLWPERNRFRVRAGQRVGWAGRSGTGSPHLHIEVRRGDLALNPLRAGLPARDLHAPELRTLTLEPLDDSSWVERGAGPLLRPLSGARETLLVEGRVRAIVRAVDPGERGASLAPWRLRETWGERWIEWSADSASWATSMADVDFVYDTGRAMPGAPPSIQLWSPGSRRPAMLRTSAPDGDPGGVIEVTPGQSPLPLTFEIDDLAGRVIRRVVWLRGPREDERGPSPRGTGRFEPAVRRKAAGAAHAAETPGTFRFTALPEGYLRLSYRGGGAFAEARLAGVPASRRDGVWHAVLAPSRLGDVLHPVFEGRDAAGTVWTDSLRPMAVADLRRGGGASALSALEWTLEARDLYEPATMLFDVVGRPARGSEELAAVSDEFHLEPASLPLRSAIRLRLDARRGELDPRTGLYVRGDDGWDWVGGRDPARPATVTGQTRQLGPFAALTDTLAPRIVTLRPPRRPPAGAYPRWTLRARVAESGSGVDAGECTFVVDGRRVPTEYDVVRRTLQWRPHTPPARGTHRYRVEAVDRAGNRRVREGTFVLD